MKKTIEDFNLENKKVIIRCDLNVPIKDGVILDDNRIKMSLKTIKYAIDNNAKVILLSHLGRIKTLSDKEKNSLYPQSNYICLGRLGLLYPDRTSFRADLSAYGRAYRYLYAAYNHKRSYLLENGKPFLS